MKSPRENEERMHRVLNALKTLAPDRKFGNKGVGELETQVGKSLAPRRRLTELADEGIEQQALRESEDINTLKMIDSIVAGVVADDEFGPDSALYEAMGYVRKSERKSGLTRKKKGSSGGDDK